ncbi:hypothetical protein [uncultured Cloacibacillus sp.]|uniref:hypothetical protein n=1 Tax=uncultured Cloacibacillus sp. TaxID=889794 RepID=UPI00320A5495
MDFKLQHQVHTQLLAALPQKPQVPAVPHSAHMLMRLEAAALRWAFMQMQREAIL